MTSKTRHITTAFGLLCWMLFSASYVFADGPGNLTAVGGGPNKHNLSVSGVSQYRAVSVTEICVFCHTPHRSLKAGPLWNHNLSTAGYVVSSASGASGTQLTEPLNPPDGDSRLCLSCHDGTVPLGAVQNLGGQSLTINMRLVGMGQLTGPSVIGTNLSGHHLVSVEISPQLNTDKNAQCQSGLINWNVKVPANIPEAYKRATGQVYAAPGTGKGVQCTSCHDPHLDNPLGSAFLRAPAVGSWSGGRYADALCVSCHCWCDTATSCQ